MKKVVQFVLKLVAVCAIVAAAACCVIAYWDKITAVLSCARDKLFPEAGRMKTRHQNISQNMLKGTRQDLPCARQQPHVVRKYFFSLSQPAR